uniref:Uncharacterized protein n=1 Tax=Rhizophora mucronata TaxID=61149 RepID=A0A2P2P1P4_RHIMU
MYYMMLSLLDFKIKFKVSIADVLQPFQHLRHKNTFLW